MKSNIISVNTSVSDLKETLRKQIIELKNSLLKLVGFFIFASFIIVLLILLTYKLFT